MKRRTATILAALALGWASTAVLAQEPTTEQMRVRRGPVLISPGGGGREGEVGTTWPTFRWTEVAGAHYELVVYEARGAEMVPSEVEPRLQVHLPAGAFSWTPDLRQGLPPGRYGWAIAALAGEGGPALWSQAALFRVTVADPPARQTPKQPAENRSLAPAALPPPGPISENERPGLLVLTEEAYAPPACATSKFADVAAGSAFCPWIEQLDRDGIMTSCNGGGGFCPKNPVTREQLAMYVGRSTRGTANWHPAEGSNPLAPPLGTAKTTVDPLSGGQYTSITTGADGLALISYYDNINQYLVVAHCSDVACSAATHSPLDTVGDVGYWTSIAIGVDGLGLISYHDATNSDLKVAHCSNVACSSADLYTLDATGLVGDFTSIAIGADGLGLISYHDATNRGLKVAHCSDVPCSAADSYLLDATGTAGYGEFSSIAIGADGLGLISYRRTEGSPFGLLSYLAVAHCSDVYCSTATATTIDPTQTVGYHTSITIGADGLGLISYRQDYFVLFIGTHIGSRRVAHCSNVECSAATVNVPPASGNVFEATSMTLGADGLGLISYQANGGGLAVAHCDTVTCSTDRPILVDGGAGAHSSVTIGADGLPIVSYGSAGGLKVAHCGNAFCTPYFRRR